MGNRSYLLIKDQHLLFEANNTLPLFWLLGLTIEAIEANESGLAALAAVSAEKYASAAEREAALLGTVAQYYLGRVVLPLSDYLQNLERNRSYIANCYPQLVDLYEAYCQVIADELAVEQTATIVIDHLEYFGFYDEYLDFYLEVDQLFAVIANQERTSWVYEPDLLGSVIGTDEYAEHHGKRLFTNESYQKLNHQLSLGSQPQVSQKKTFIEYLGKLFGK